MTTPANLKCPQCGAPLSMEDVNVSTDVIFCRSCNHVGKFSEMVQENEDGGILDQVPTRLKVVKTARGLEVTYKASKLMGIFFLFFAVFWNGITYAVMFSELTKAGSGTFERLFCLPFMLVGAGMLVAAVYVLFGGMRLTLQPGRGELFRGVGGIGRRRQFVLTKDARISLEESRVMRTQGTPLMGASYRKILYKIVVTQPVGKPLEFGAGINEYNVQQYIAALLRQMRA